ncbi:MAG: hypothetical protein JO301_13960 [Chitinophagaceae bacterium]|nr:hypothetical protein [Chitinophagaceae bacterium]
MQPKPMADSMPPQKETISLAEAQERCNNWIETFQKLVPEADVKQIPKAIFFHWADIEQIVNDYKPDYKINGVRIYFAMTELGGEYQIKGIMIPTVPSPNDPLRSDDLVIPVPIVPRPGGDDGLGDDDEGVSIYDFSKPCPTYCDESFGSIFSKRRI